MLSILIFTFKTLVIFSYLIAGLFIIDLANTTTIADMTFNDYLICSIGTLFIMFSMLALLFISKVNHNG
jgi:hypothetical protein